ncbi:MAG: helix-turn-helix domain-containing protein [Rhodospirillaceae bacterium]
MAGIQPLESVARFTTILSAVSAGDGITMSELTRKAGLSRSAVNRYMVTLAELGYVYRDERTKRYRPTSKTLDLSRGVTRDQKIRQIVLPPLQAACRTLGWSLNFSTLKNAQVTLIAHTDDISPLAKKKRGTMLMRPLLGRAAGHVLLAHLLPSVRMDVLKIALQQNPALYADAGIGPDDLPALLEDVQRLGYGAYTTAKAQLNTVAVPVRIKDTFPFVLSAGATASILSLEQVTERFLTPLQACANNISERLKDIDTDRWLDASEDQPVRGSAP